MKIKNTLKISVFAILLILALGYNSSAYAKEYKLNATFEPDERLFTFMAWMNWVADIDPKEAQKMKYPAQVEIRKYLKSLPQNLYIKHRKAYDKYLSTSSLYVKNGLLISDSQYYGYPPNFKLHLPDEKSIDPFGSMSESEKRATVNYLQDMPSGELLEEFYKTAKIKDIWNNKYKKLHQDIINRYKSKTEKKLKSILIELKAEQKYPVAIVFNLLGNFGISGQSTFSQWEKKFIIKIIPELKKDEYYESVTIGTIRHELAHSLLNPDVKKNQNILKNPISKFAKKINLRWYRETEPAAYVPELVAQCIGYIDIEDYLRENVFYYNQNILFMHFIDKLPDFRKSGKTFIEYLPELFKSFDADKELKRWKTVEEKIKKMEAELEKSGHK